LNLSKQKFALYRPSLQHNSLLKSSRDLCIAVATTNDVQLAEARYNEANNILIAKSTVLRRL